MSESELDGRNLLVQPAQVNRERRERRDRFSDRGDRGDRGDRYADRGDRYGDRGDRYGDRGNRYGDRGDRGEREQRQFAPGTRVWVSNLPFSAEWQDVKDAFRDVGQVSSIGIGWGQVCFDAVISVTRRVSSAVGSCPGP